MSSGYARKRTLERKGVRVGQKMMLAVLDVSWGSNVVGATTGVTWYHSSFLSKVRTTHENNACEASSHTMGKLWLTNLVMGCHMVAKTAKGKIFWMKPAI